MVPQELRARKYHQAAVGHFAYGIIYLAGAIYSCQGWRGAIRAE